MKILTNKTEMNVQDLNPSIVMMNYDIMNNTFQYEKYIINSRKEYSVKGVRLTFKSGYSNNNNIHLDIMKDAELYVHRQGLEEPEEENRLIKKEYNPLSKFKRMKAKDIQAGDLCLKYKVLAGKASVESYQVLETSIHTEKTQMFKVKSTNPLVIDKFIVFFP